MTIQAKALVRLTGIILTLFLLTTIAAKAQAGAGDLGSTESFNINEKSVEIKKGGDYTITGNGQTGNTITVDLKDGGTANITIEGVDILKTGEWECPFSIEQGTVHLTLAGDDNVLEARASSAALKVSDNSVLVITEKSTGKLTARGGDSGAGIGASQSSIIGSIIIAGGTVEATGGNGEAGIGGFTGSITISGGTVKATGGSNAAGIGGFGGSITISGGTVKATGGSNAAGIGGSAGRAGGTIIIAGGTVEATGGARAAGIGGGSGSSGGSITIEGGKITTEGNIGDGEGSRDATGEIKGGTIVCKSISPTLSITGGSVRTEDISVIDGKVMAVVKGSSEKLPANAKVKSITIGRVTYNWTDVYTDENGMLYLYLNQDQLGSATVTIDTQTYTANASREYDITKGPITITAAGDYAIVGGGQTGNTIKVDLKDGGIANITIEGVDIKTNVCPFNIIQGTVKLTLVGKDNILQAGMPWAALQVTEDSKLLITEESKAKLTATGGNFGAGIGGSSGSPAGSITIAGGTVVATGGHGAAGIGGGDAGNVGSIIITGGTVEATGGDFGAGIGGGSGSFGGTITIEGGKITTEGNIGAGEYGSVATSEISGGTIVCKSISPAFTITGGSVRTKDNSVVGGKGMAVVKGLPEEKEVTSITIGKETYNWKDVYTDKNGMLYLYLKQDQPGSATVTIEGLKYTANASREYNVFNETVEIKAAGDYIITGNSQETNHIITVELPSPTDVANITIKGVNIQTGDFVCPFNIKQGTVNLTLVEGNELQAGDLCAALQVSENSVLVITEKSTGTLTARGGASGAGIGGGRSNDAGIITIAGGTVEATGGSGAAGIGGGSGGFGGTITIKGGTVMAAGGSDGAGIGGGSGSRDVSITISGGTVMAAGGSGGAGIGGGSGGFGGSITIAGGTVDATGRDGGAGIGGGYGSRVGTITIEGGKITTEGNIGDGESGSGATGEISGGTIDCKSISPALSITGGSVRTKDNSFVGDKGMAVVKGLPNETEVKSIQINEAPYGSTDVFTDKNGQLYLYIPKAGAVPVSITIDDKVYTLHVTLEPVITISGKVESYDESIHKDKSILIDNNGTFTIDAPDASVIDLTIKPGGKLLTNKELKVEGGFTVEPKADDEKWITFCSPVPLKLLNQRWATWAGDTNCLFLKSGFTTANDQEWTLEQSLKEDTPYLIGVPTGVVACTLYAQNVKLPGRKEDISIDPPSDFDNNLLFRANTSLTEQKLKDIYVLEVPSQKLVLKTEDYILKPFEAYFIASPATRNMLKTISLLGSDEQPTGIAEVKVQKNTNFKAYSNSPGTLTFENQGEPAAVIVVNALGKGMFVYSNFTGRKHLYGLSAGVYFVRSNKEVKTVIVY